MFLRGLIGGRSRARTYDPLIKSVHKVVYFQCIDRHITADYRHFCGESLTVFQTELWP